MNLEAMNGSMLAFVGDAYFDLKIREMLITRGINNSKKFHQLTVFYVSANAQAMMLHSLLDMEFLTEIERAIVRKGRNVSGGTTRKNTDVITYRQSTGFEALIGYLYLLKDQDRLNQVVEMCISIRRKDEL